MPPGGPATSSVAMPRPFSNTAPSRSAISPASGTRASASATGSTAVVPTLTTVLPSAPICELISRSRVSVAPPALMVTEPASVMPSKDASVASGIEMVKAPLASVRKWLPPGSSSGPKVTSKSPLAEVPVSRTVTAVPSGTFETVPPPSSLSVVS